MIKRLKKELQINIEEKEGQLFLGEKKKDMRLVMLRPNEIMEFCEFAGTNAEDILIWVGKSLGKIFMEKFFYEKDWSTESIAVKKEVIFGTLEVLMLMGYGGLTGMFKKDHIIINVYESLAFQEKGNIMAKNLCLLYLGIFNSVFDVLGIDVDGEEVECILTGGEKCSYKFDLIGEEFDDNLVDEDMSDIAVSEFLASL
jgi:predicted hydrocarbon binding protein